MDFKYVISQFLGIQDIIIEDIKLFKKDLRAVIIARQNKKYCYFNKVILAPTEWIHLQFRSMACAFAEHAGRLMKEITC